MENPPGVFSQGNCPVIYSRWRCSTAGYLRPNKGQVMATLQGNEEVGVPQMVPNRTQTGPITLTIDKMRIFSYLLH
jgi:hypothetical protein